MRQAGVREQAINGTFVVLGAIILGFGTLVWLYGTHYPLHHDLAGGLLTAALAAELGPDFGSYNSYFPPAERIWYGLAVGLGTLTGFGTDVANITLTTAAVLISTGLATILRRRTGERAGPIFFGVSFLVLLAIPILFKNIFGLREHIVVLGLWPYLVLRAAPPERQKVGPGLRVALGLWMGTTLLLKYFYAIVVLLIEITDALLQRRIGPLFKAENLIAAAIVAAYLGVWLVADPAQRAAIGTMRSAIGANLLPLGVTLSIAGPWLMAALLLATVARLSGVDRRTILIGFLAVLGATAVAWLQERWYTHHLFPILTAFLGWWWLVGTRLAPWAHVIAAIMVLIAIEREFSRTGWYVVRVNEVAKTIEAAGIDLDGKRIGVLSMHPAPYNQVILASGGLRWSPYVNVAYLAAVLQPFDQPGATAPRVTLDDPGHRMLHMQQVRLWEDQPPDVLILDRTFKWPLRHIDIDWVEIFADEPRISAVFAKFTPLFTHDTPRLTFEYYVRAD